MKRYLLYFSALPFFILLAACGGSAPQTPSAPANPAINTAQPTAIPTLSPTETPVPAAQTTTEAGSAAAANFSGGVMPILEAKCTKCHGIESVKEGLKLLTYEDVILGSFNGPVIVPGNADESLLVQMVAKGKMPKRGTKVTPEELQLIKDWINQGAQNN